MKRLSLLLIAWILLQSLCFAAGTATSTCTVLGNGPLWIVTFSWTGDASGGSVPATASTCLSQNVLQGLSIVQAETIPGSPSPTGGYAVTLTDANGVDITAGQLSALSASSAAMWTITAPPLNGTLTLHVSGNSVNSAQGSVVLYLAPGNYARSRGSGSSGGGGTWGSITGMLSAQTDLATALGLKLPLAGGTMTGSLLFTDASFDIGASGATRPRDIFTSRDVTVGRNLLVGASLSVDPTTGIATTSKIGNAALSLLTGAGKWLNGVPVGQAAFSDLTGSVAAAQLPNPSASTLGGIQSYVAVSNQWIRSISTSGVPASSQPAFTDISGSATAAQLPNVPVTISTSGAVSDPGGANDYQFNNASGALTFNAPAGVAGLQRCYRNATTRTGVITIQMASSNTVDVNGANGSSAGTLVSSGALGDAVCLVSDASNHWYAYPSSGVWTNN